MPRLIGTRIRYFLIETNTAVSILVAEDDLGVRDVAVQMLKIKGFDEIETEAAKAGLEQFKQHPLGW